MYTRIKALMDKKGISEYRLAKDIGIHQSTITLWKKGECEPNLRTTVKLARYFEVPIDYFVD